MVWYNICTTYKVRNIWMSWEVTFGVLNNYFDKWMQNNIRQVSSHSVWLAVCITLESPFAVTGRCYCHVHRGWFALWFDIIFVTHNSNRLDVPNLESRWPKSLYVCWELLLCIKMFKMTPKKFICCKVSKEHVFYHLKRKSTNQTPISFLQSCLLAKIK